MEVRKDSNITYEGEVLNFKYEKKTLSSEVKDGTS